jgi:GAF domain-containing protein
MDLIAAELDEVTALAELQAVVRSAPRRLLGADGATFVLRDVDMCFYADEDAMSPLWKGQRFPIERCISGWAMLNDASAVVPDITVDERIPQEAYRPTFVRSLVMVPVGAEKPIAAIGTYWARTRRPTADEVATLEELAALVGAALERVGTAAAPFLRPSIVAPA